MVDVARLAAWMREFMAAHGGRCVLKYDGLAEGKGVWVVMSDVDVDLAATECAALVERKRDDELRRPASH